MSKDLFYINNDKIEKISVEKIETNVIKDNNRYIAIDGSEYDGMLGVYEANKRFYDRMLIPSDDEEKDKNNSLFIKSILEIIYNIQQNKVFLPEWTNFFLMLKIMNLPNSFVSKEFVVYFAKALRNASIIMKTTDEIEKYQKMINELDQIILANNSSKTVKR